MRYLLFLLTLLLFAPACTDDQDATTDPTTAVVPPANDNTSVIEPMEPLQPLPGEKVVRGNKVLEGGQSKRLLYELTQNYWYIHALLKMGDKDFNFQNRGRWFHFNPDNTYESGYLSETGQGGKWSYDPQKATLHLEANNFNESGEYRVKMGQSGTIMIWEGTERYKQTAIQGKLEKYNRIGEYELPQRQ